MSLESESFTGEQLSGTYQSATSVQPLRTSFTSLDESRNRRESLGEAFVPFEHHKCPNKLRCLWGRSRPTGTCPQASRLPWLTSLYVNGVPLTMFENMADVCESSKSQNARWPRYIQPTRWRRHRETIHVPGSARWRLALHNYVTQRRKTSTFLLPLESNSMHIVAPTIP